MRHVVIIGAGPAGLYLASKLKQKGIRNIIIYDPRAGEYVRPGYLNPSIFKQAEAGIKTKLPFSKPTSHIKDIEKSLYQFVIPSNITIEKKKFVRFSDEEKGIFVASKNEEGELVEEFVACDYVFDCTGGKRAVMHEINKRQDLRGMTKPFEVTAVSEDVVVKNHLIAYMRINNEIAKQANNTDKPKMLGKSPLEYARAIEELRQFGWTEFTFPDCHSTFFKDDKNCLYIECPDNLLPTDKRAWLDTVLKILTNKTDIPYEFVESTKGRSVPNFNIFTVNPHQLNSFTYHERGMPEVIALGDAQIEPNFVLGHGIKGSFERTDTLIKGMVLIAGKITYYDSAEYNESVQHDIKRHRQDIISYYRNHKLAFRKGLYEAKAIYEQAIIDTQDVREKRVFSERLQEISARITYYDALKILEKQNQTVGDDQLGKAINELTTVKRIIEQALNLLTPFEQGEALKALQRLVLAFKDLGNQFYKLSNFMRAIRAYEGALNLYSSNPIKTDVERLSLYSNPVICYRKTGQVELALEKAKEALEMLDYASGLVKQKILFHFIKLAYDSLGGVTCPSSKQLELLETLGAVLKTHNAYIEQHLKTSLNLELVSLNQLLKDTKEAAQEQKIEDECRASVKVNPSMG